MKDPRQECIECEHHVSPDGSGRIITGMILWENEIFKERHMCQLLLCKDPGLMKSIKEYEVKNGLR